MKYFIYLIIFIQKEKMLKVFDKIRSGFEFHENVTDELLGYLIITTIISKKFLWTIYFYQKFAQSKFFDFF